MQAADFPWSIPNSQLTFPTPAADMVNQTPPANASSPSSPARKPLRNMVQTLPPPASTSRLLDQISIALQSSPYVPSQRVLVETQEGAVRLSGNVSSFFQKQMAQEVIRRVDGVEQIENLLEVSWT